MSELVSSMSAEELSDLIYAVLTRKEEEKKKLGTYKDLEIGRLTVEQFTELMVSVAETKAYLAAKREEEVTKRIFKDVNQLIVGGITPFRIKSTADAKEFVSGMHAYFDTAGGKGSFVVAAALVQEKEE